MKKFADQFAGEVQEERGAEGDHSSRQAVHKEGQGFFGKRIFQPSSVFWLVDQFIQSVLEMAQFAFIAEGFGLFGEEMACQEIAQVAEDMDGMHLQLLLPADHPWVFGVVERDIIRL